MQYERRADRRQSISLAVDLCQPGRKNRTYQVRNLTPDGMLLANDAQLFQPGARVTIEVQHHAQSWCIPAVVTHSNNDCIGVMFQQRQAELFRNLSGSMMHLARGGGRHFMLRRANRQRGA